MDHATSARCEIFSDCESSDSSKQLSKRRKEPSMGCDIHSFAEKRDEHGVWQALPEFEPFEQRSYSVFAWLAGVRNYSAITPLSEPRGLPVDVSQAVRIEHKKALGVEHPTWGFEVHTASWLSVQELVSFDFDAPMENRRVTKQITPWHSSGAETCKAGQGEMTTYRKFLGPWFFKDLEMLQRPGGRARRLLVR